MDKRSPNNASYYSHPDMFQQAYFPIKPLYMLIKVDVDAGIVRTMRDSEIYAQNHCDKLEYQLVECYYPDDEQYPYIAK